MSPTTKLPKADITSPRDGGTLRTREVVRELERRGYVVDVLAVTGRTEVIQGVARPTDLLAAFTTLGAFLATGSLTATRWYSPRLAVEAASRQRRITYSGIVVEYSQLLPYARGARLPVWLDLHNAEGELMGNYAASTRGLRKFVARWEAQRLKRLEQVGLRGVAGASVVSRRDLETVNPAEAPDAPLIVVAPNGVGDQGFQTRHDPGDTVVFVAHLGWRPNIDAAIWLVQHVWPEVRRHAPWLRLQLVGRSPHRDVRDLRADDIEIFGDVPSVGPFLSRARVATAPLLAAGGTRLKIVEALSYGVPVVSTTLGALGLEERFGSVLQIADDPAEFARRIVGLASASPDPDTVRVLAADLRWPSTLNELGAAADTVFRRHDEAARSG